MDPLARLSPPMWSPDIKSKAAKPRPPASAFGRVFGNRDYALTVECFDDLAVLYPSGQTFTMKGNQDLAKSEQTKIDETLVRAVLQLISRRQATVKAGEPPYRPLLRFQVHPDGLRTFLHVYPLLENLRIPMTRENLES